MSQSKTLRGFLAELEHAGELERHERPVSLREITRIVESSRRAVLFEKVAGCETSFVANAMASRTRWGIALGVDATDVMFELARRLQDPIAPTRVSEAPVHDVVVTGDDVDITRLPAYLQHELDGGPYISASMDVTRDPESGRYNTGVRRLMLRGRATTGVDLVAPSDARALYRRAREAGRRFEIAFVIGLHPLDYMATQLRGVGDEFEVMGGIRREPVQLVRCLTVDLEVPAHAEVVLEGYLDGDWITPEGPFGEYHGAYGDSHLNPVFRVTGITRRRDAVFQTATIGGRHLDHTDTALIAGICTEVAVWESLKRAVAEPRQVYCPPAGTGLHDVRIAINARDPGDGRNALLAALSSTANCKYAIAVDDDVDIFSDSMVEWAVTTRSQPDTDVIVMAGLRTLPLDPSLPPVDGPVLTAKMGIDATKRKDKPHEIFDIPRAPFEDSELPIEPADGDRLDDTLAIQDTILEVARDGARFVDFLVALPEVHEGDVVRAIGYLFDREQLSFEQRGIYRAASVPETAERPPA